MVSHATSQQSAIAEYLSSIATRDIRGRYICPQSDVRTDLEQEIQQRTGCTPANLTNEAKELQRMSVSAEREKFVQDTLNALENISDTLKRQRAKQFEIRFVNPQGDPQWWGDQILVGVRYLT